MTDVTLIELEMYRPGAGPGARYARGVRPLGLPPLAIPLEATATLTASDTGYRTRASDPGGVVAYPPTVDTALEITEALNLEPGKSAVAWSAGDVKLRNLTGEYDQTEATFNCDRRTLTIKRGARVPDAARGIETDPAYSGLTTLFTGLAQPWMAGEDTLTIPVRDATYWLEQPLQTALYDGSGGYNGTAGMEGVPVPKLRGGSATDPVLNIKPVQVDPTVGLYQINDAAAAVYALFAGADALPSSDRVASVTDAYATVCPPGKWRTVARPNGAYVQLGSPLLNGYELTCNASGSFPVAGAASLPGNLLRYLLTEDASLPAALLDLPSITIANGAAWPCGDYWTSTVTTADAIAPILASIGAQLVPRPDGKLALVLLRAVPANAVPVARYTAAQMLAAPRPVPLPAGLSPPPWRWLVGHSRNHTVQSGSNLDPDVTEERRIQLAASDQVALAWQDQTLLTAYRLPNAPDAVSTRLLRRANALQLGQAWGELWGTERRLVEITVDLDEAIAVPLGAVVHVTYDVRSLRNGVLCRVVRRVISLGNRSITLTVLV